MLTLALDQHKKTTTRHDTDTRNGDCATNERRRRRQQPARPRRAKQLNRVRVANQATATSHDGDDDDDGADDGACICCARVCESPSMCARDSMLRAILCWRVRRVVLHTAAESRNSLRITCLPLRKAHATPAVGREKQSRQRLCERRVWRCGFAAGATSNASNATDCA